MAERRDFDVCVIGTGAGGGVMCQELTRAGFDVVALQRGPELSADRFDDDELGNILREELFGEDHLETYRHDAGEQAAPGRYNPAGNTVGGLMLAELGRIPRAGDSIQIGNLSLTVEAMRRRRIERILLQRLSKTEADR